MLSIVNNAREKRLIFLFTFTRFSIKNLNWTLYHDKLKFTIKIIIEERSNQHTFKISKKYYKNMAGS